MKKSIIKTKLDVNFNKNIVDVYIYEILKTTKKVIQAKENQEEFEIQDDKSITDEQLQIIGNEDVMTSKPKLLFSHNFKISEDFESVVVNNNKFEIPSFFNRKTIQDKDLKTWEMVFYCVFDTEINTKIRNILNNNNFAETERFL